MPSLGQTPQPELLASGLPADGAHLLKELAFAPDGSLLHTSLEESRTDYAGAFAMLRQLPQPALPVLREEAVPARAASDIAFMKGFF